MDLFRDMLLSGCVSELAIADVSQHDEVHSQRNTVIQHVASLLLLGYYVIVYY